MVATYNVKGNPLQCCKHRGLRLLEHDTKNFEKVLYHRFEELGNVVDELFGS